MSIRRSVFFIGATAILTATAFSLLIYTFTSEKKASDAHIRTGRLVDELGLTDLALFTEASYTRHPTMTDFNTPFQDSPMSFEHFPTGSLLKPPAHVDNHVKKH